MTLTLYSWNVNGVRAIEKKGFADWLQHTQPDILTLQETKIQADQLTPSLSAPPGYHSYWAHAERKGYSGVVLYSKTEPLRVTTGLGIGEYDSEGRTIVAEYDDFYFIGAYFPNGSRDHSRVPFKMAYKAAFLAHCNHLRKSGKGVIFAGDINTAHQEIDLARPKENTKTTGFLPEERAWFADVIRDGYVDVFRQQNPNLGGAYTWWSNRSGARERNIGWRIDFFFASQELLPRLGKAAIHPQVLGSDHCPISLVWG